MNLGDGLLLHLENGKPQIVLLHRGATSGINKLYRPGLPRRPKGPLTSSAPLASSSTRRSTVTSRNSSKTPANHTTVVKSRAVSVLSVPERYRPPPRVPSSNRTTKTPANGRTRQTEALANGDADMREGLARLTNQEPTASSTFLSPDEEEVLKPSADQTQPEQNNPLLLPLRAPPPALAPPQAGAPPPSLAAPVSPPRALAAPRGRGREGQSSSCGGRASFLRSMTALLDPAELEERERRRSKQQDQLRAIEAQLAEQREQREEEKRRGEEEKRREEEAEEQRKMKEQAEQNILHLPLKAPPKALTPPQSLAPPPSPATPVSPPRAPATPPGPGRGEEPSSCGERASFLRSMTALLDPAEMEERERRRSKQQDQLRAIEAQLAEQREQREEEKRREEETEEKRKEQVEQIPQQQEVLLSSEKPIRELPRSHGHVVLKQHSVSIRGPKGGQGAKGEEPTRNKKRGKGDLYQELARPERTDTPRGLPAVRPPGPSSHHPEQDYFPYVRTADIIHLEPLDRNGTATPHPTNTHGQKEILLSLAALRKGLLQKQKEMESSGRLLPPVTSQRS